MPSLLRPARGRPSGRESARPRRKRQASEAVSIANRPGNFWARARYYDQLTGVFAISRRYFVIGAFDGALTVLGLVLGAAGQTNDVTVILAAGLATSVALAVSSAFGAYEAERVEQDLQHQELESAMLTPVRGDKISAHRFAKILSSLIHGMAPMVAGLLPLVPFVLVPALFTFEYAVIASVGITLVFLFMLGVFLGRLTGRNVAVAGIRLIVVAIATAIVTFLIGGHSGL